MMEKDIFDKIHEIDFADLSQAEREEFADLFSSEEEFESMKAFLTKVDDNKAVFAPSDSAKAKLDDVFAETYPTENQKKGLIAFLWPQGTPLYRKPLLQVAAVLLLIFTAIPFIQNDTALRTNEVAQAEVLEDEKSVDEVKKKEVQPEEKEVEVILPIGYNGNRPEVENQNAPEANRIVMDVSEDDKSSKFMTPSNTEVYSFYDQAKGAVDGSLSPGTAFAKLDSNHPDLNFDRAESDEVSMSIPSENPTEEIFDLITAAF